MKSEKNTEKKSGASVLDIFIILALLMCVTATVFAFVFKQNTAEKNVTEAQLEDYVLSFRVDSMRQSTMNMIEAGDTFYTENSKDFGTLQDSLTMTPAVVYVQKDDGTYVKTYSPENGDYTKWDVSGTFTVKGIRNSNGIFLLNGNVELAPNKSYTVINDTVSMSLLVTAIEKVSK